MFGFKTITPLVSRKIFTGSKIMWSWLAFFNQSPKFEVEAIKITMVVLFECGPICK